MSTRVEHVDMTADTAVRFEYIVGYPSQITVILGDGGDDETHITGTENQLFRLAELIIGEIEGQIREV